MADVVGIGGDNASHAEVAGAMPPAPVEVEAGWGGVDFNPCAGGGGGLEDSGNIKGVGLALEEETPGEVADGGDVGILNSAEDAAGVAFRVGGGCVVQRGDGEIELGK